MRYPLANLGQVGQNLILSRDFNAFYSTAVSSATAIADIARSKDLTEDELGRVNQELGRIRDYTVPTVPPAPSAPGCPACPACDAAQSDSRRTAVLAAAALILGLSAGALLL